MPLGRGYIGAVRTAAQTRPQAVTPQKPGMGTVRRSGAFGQDPYAGMDTGNPYIAAENILTNPARISGLTQSLFSQLASSPAFAETMRQLAGYQSNLGTAIQSGLGRTGLSSSGIGGVVSGLAKTGGQSAIAQARADLFKEALRAALAQINQLPGAAATISQEAASKGPKTFFGQLSGGRIGH